MRYFILLLISGLSFLCNAQNPTRIVTGTLTDPESGEPMGGVSIIVKGSTIGTTTDVNGHYNIEAPIGSVLVFSFIGYTSREMIVEPLPVAPSGDSIQQKILRHHIPENTDDKTLSPYFFVKSDNPEVDQMPLKLTSATVNIAGVIADVKIKQIYINAGKNVLEAMYIFPGSTRAAVYGMTMTIGNRRVVAKIREKEQARQEYATAKQQGKTVTLLEQNRPNVFQMNVGNILPGDTITVELKYSELLVPTEGIYEFVYPTVVGPRYSEIPNDDKHQDENWVQNPYHKKGELPDYTFNLFTRINSGIPIRKVTSPSHHINVTYPGANMADIRLAKDETAGGNRDFIMRYRLRGGDVESGILLNPTPDENFFLLMMEPPEAPTIDQIPPREYIFVVDVSGSMHGFPLDVSKTLLNELISSLRPDDKFNVMLFESSNSMLNDESVPATEYNIQRALKVLTEQQGGGGTRLYPALKEALQYKKAEGYSRTFVVITDGYVTVEKEAFNLVRQNLNDANLFAFGIGSSVNRYLIEGLAHAGMGEPFVVTSVGEAEAIGDKFKDLIANPVLTSIKVEYDNFDAYDVEPQYIPDVFSERPIIIYGKYRGNSTGSIHVTGYSGNSQYSRSFKLSSASSKDNEALRYLWARNKIKYLSDFAKYFEGNDVINGNTDDNSNVKQITNLGLRYNLLTQYTSFIAVDSVIRTKSEPTKIKQPLPLPSGLSNLSVSGLPASFTLTPDVSTLSECVVVGYGTQQKTYLVSSVESVLSQSFDTSSPSVNSVLQGMVAGVQVTQNKSDQDPNTTVRVRGNSSIVGNNVPLYVVNGVIIDNQDIPSGSAGIIRPDKISDINVHDIESIEVLKGPAACSVYGSRGANGVVLITTKAPKYGKAEMIYNTSFFLQQLNKLPALQNGYSQGRSTSSGLQWFGADSNETLSWGPSIKSLAFDGKPFNYDQQGRLVPLNQGNGVMARDYNPYKLFTNGYSFDHHLRVSRRTDKKKYDISVGYSNQRGIIPGTGRERVTSSLLFEKRLLDDLKLGSNILLCFGTGHYAQQGNSGASVMQTLLTTPPTFDNGNGLSGRRALSAASAYELSDHSQRQYSNVVDNPYWSIANNHAASTTYRVIPSAYLEYKGLRSLTFKYKISGDINNDNMVYGYAKGSSASLQGSFLNRNELLKSMNSELMVRGERNFLYGKIEVDGTVGLINYYSNRSIRHTDGEELKASASFDYDNANVLKHLYYGYSVSNTRMLTLVNAKYSQFLSVQLSAVKENTSTVSKGNNHLSSYGAGVALVLTDIPGLNLSSSGVISMAKIMVNVGSIQKESPLYADPNLYQATVNSITTPTLFSERMNIQTNSNLKPEKSQSVELGTNLDFIQDRIRITAYVYRSKTSQGYVPLYTGTDLTLINGGVIGNSGFDGSINATLVQRAVRWTMGANFTRARSMVKSLPNGFDRIALSGFTEISSSLMAGQPYGVLYGTRYLRDGNGNVIIGSDGYPIVDSKLGVLGNPTPDWTMGITNTISYKSVSLNILFDIRKGGMVWNGTRNTLNYFGVSKTTGEQRETKGYVFRGVIEGGTMNSKPVDFYDPAANVSENRWVRYGKAGVAEDAIENGGWVRLRRLTLSYNFSSKGTKKIRFKSLSFTGTNLFLITKYSGVDPETNLTGNTNGRGLDYFNSPQVRSYGISLKVGL